MVLMIFGPSTERKQNTEQYEETWKSLEYLREVSIPLCGLNYLMEQQLWRLLDLRDGGGLGLGVSLHRPS